MLRAVLKLIHSWHGPWVVIHMPAYATMKKHNIGCSKLNVWVTFCVLFPQTATAWRCFTFSKQPVTTTSEPTQQASHMATVSSPSVINHVMHASYEEVRFANISLCVAAIHTVISCQVFCFSAAFWSYCTAFFPLHTENNKEIIGLRLWSRHNLKPSSSSGTAFSNQ